MCTFGTEAKLRSMTVLVRGVTEKNERDTINLVTGVIDGGH